MGTTPEHVAIIPDGNRRFARRLMKQPWKGHEWGAKKLSEVVDWLKEYGVKIVTVYALSWENLLKRPKDEFDYLMKIIENEILNLIDDERVHRDKIRIRVIGRYNKLPEFVVKALEKIQEVTKEYDGYFINLAIAYGGRQEIVDAFRKLLERTEESPQTSIGESEIKKMLYTDGMKDPELIIRTGGERRLSNFLLWQAAYSELYFIDKLWPEIERKDIEEALENFRTRKRRLGG